MAATDYDFQSTRTDIVQRALRIVGAIGSGDEASAEQNADAVLALNQLVKSWQSEHVFLWTIELKELSLVASQATYTLPTDPAVIWVDRAFYRDSSGHDGLELQIIPFQEYAEIPVKTSTGRPVVMALDSKPSPTAYLWPVPNATDKIYYAAVERLQDWESATGSSGFDPRWDLALVYGLAAELAPENGISITEQNKLEGRAAREFLKAKSGNREHTTETFVRSAFRTRRR